jgi:hypothetical protein
LSKFASKSRTLIVGEGRETEYNYFVGFRNAHEKILEAMAISITVRRGAGGDARGIVENAIKEAKKFKPDRKRGDRVFVLLDAEGPGNSPGKGRTPELPAAENLAAKNGIEIIYSCPSFEYWLLCHFHKIPRGHFADSAAVITALNKKWNAVAKDEYDKADLDIFKRLAGQLDAARAQALKIDLHRISSSGAAHRANPSTQVYELIAILVGAKSGEKCPLAGTWTHLEDASVSVKLQQGDTMPTHDNKPTHWRFTG